MDAQVYIGFDSRERLAWQVCAASMQARASAPVSISQIGRIDLERRGLYTRRQHDEAGVQWDDVSAAPVSTDFALARFWVPQLAGRSGWALYCDCDFLWRGDVRALFALAEPRYAVQVVKHDHAPTESVKMERQVQTSYPRKNWSSLMLFNLSHAGAQRLQPGDLNGLPGRDLHAFCWLKGEEIGELPIEWNWLDGYSDPAIDAAAAHLTRGTPDMPGWEWTRYAREWNQYAQAFMTRAA